MYVDEQANSMVKSNGTQCYNRNRQASDGTGDSNNRVIRIGSTDIRKDRTLTMVVVTYYMEAQNNGI